MSLPATFCVYFCIFHPGNFIQVFLMHFQDLIIYEWYTNSSSWSIFCFVSKASTASWAVLVVQRMFGKSFPNFFSVSLQSIGDGGMEIIKMKVFSVRHTFIGGNNNHSATTEEPVCVLSWSVLAYVFKLHLANCWHLMKKVCLHKEVAFIVEVFFCLYKFAIFLNTEFRFGDTCFMLEKNQTFGESFSVLNITV